MSILIKPEPEQTEQDDLIMSYLNTDYLSTDTPLSPPSSITSLSDNHLSDTSSPLLDNGKDRLDDFLIDINSSDFNNDPALWSSTFNPCLQPPTMLHGFPFFIPNSIPYIQSFTENEFIKSSDEFIKSNQFIKPSTSSSTCSVSDSEQPKKKRGRKKRETPTQSSIPQPSLAPKPLAPRMDVVKQEEKERPMDTDTQEQQKAMQLAKRQERLIKNRAAALLSRKRKREHLSSLEEEKQGLLKTNRELELKVVDLEEKLRMMERENGLLRQQLNKKNPLLSAPKPSKATGVVFMIMLFSFALFTLPSRTASRLTVGGSMEYQKQFPMIGPSSDIDYSVELQCSPDEACEKSMPKSTDLILIDPVQPRDLRSWIDHKLDSTKDLETLVPYNKESHLYLYSSELSQIASPPSNGQGQPLLSLISPYNSSSSTEYLQIDVQVLGSRVIDANLLSLNQCNSVEEVLLGMKQDLVTDSLSQPSIDTPPYPRRRSTKKMARVII
ncbi:hypothetical protein BDB01DRAFT_907099 [Pilobolus umbonatus]|nr:hypothetical protein BDB01DRAFT_907099 [Pilobolus umbonatus]